MFFLIPDTCFSRWARFEVELGCILIGIARRRKEGLANKFFAIDGVPIGRKQEVTRGRNGSNFPFLDLCLGLCVKLKEDPSAMSG